MSQVEEEEDKMRFSGVWNDEYVIGEGSIYRLMTRLKAMFGISWLFSLWTFLTRIMKKTSQFFLKDIFIWSTKAYSKIYLKLILRWQKKKKKNPKEKSITKNNLKAHVKTIYKKFQMISDYIKLQSAKHTKRYK